MALTKLGALVLGASFGFGIVKSSIFVHDYFTKKQDTYLLQEHSYNNFQSKKLPNQNTYFLTVSNNIISDSSKNSFEEMVDSCINSSSYNSKKYHSSKEDLVIPESLFNKKKVLYDSNNIKITVNVYSSSEKSIEDTLTNYQKPLLEYNPIKIPE